jgi:hypothetical protein
MSEQKTYSISCRLRRTITEEAFVLVLVADEVKQDTPDKKGRYFLDGKKVMDAAVCLGSDPATRWTRESEVVVELHPVQVAPPEDSDDTRKIK